MNRTIKPTVRFLISWALLFALSIVVRLPYFLSINMYFDIDESVVGIMAQDMLETGRVPYYFYLQNYGLSLFETLSAALFITMFGSTVWALKLGGLLIFSLGLTFLYRTLEEKWIAPKWALYLLVVFILCYPAWYLWGGMLRGGYVTAFTASCAMLYLVRVKPVNLPNLILAALFLYIGYDAHALIAIGMVPLTGYWIWNSERRWLNGGIFAVAFVGAVSLFHALFFNDGYGTFDQSFGFMEMIRHFNKNMEGFHAAFTNRFSYGIIFDIPGYWMVFSWILLALMGVVWLMGLILASGRQRWFLLICTAGALGAMLAIAAGPHFAPRYLLGFWTMALICTVLSVKGLLVTWPRTAKGLTMGLTVLAFIGITSGSKMRSHWSTKPESHLVELEKIFQDMKSHGIRATVSLDNTSVWNFMYGNQIPSVGICGLDRMTKFKDKVYDVYLEDSTKIAVFGHWGSDAGMRKFKEYDERFHLPGIGFFYVINPTGRMLEEARKNSGCEFVLPLFEKQPEIQ